MRLALAAVIAVPIVSGTTDAQQLGARPREAGVCDVSKRPELWDHSRIRVSALATLDFERFVLSDPACDTAEGLTRIWITFGGRVSSGAIYCCPGEGDRTLRSQPLVVEGVTLPLVDNITFRAFQKLLQRREPVAARVTLVGTFFAGEKLDSELLGRGYGHFACCALFVIERVERFEEVRAAGQP